MDWKTKYANNMDDLLDGNQKCVDLIQKIDETCKKYSDDVHVVLSSCVGFLTLVCMEYGVPKQICLQNVSDIFDKIYDKVKHLDDKGV